MMTTTVTYYVDDYFRTELLLEPALAGEEDIFHLSIVASDHSVCRLMIPPEHRARVAAQLVTVGKRLQDADDVLTVRSRLPQTPEG